MAIYLYVDNSNVFIEGKRASAVKKKIAGNIVYAMNNKLFDDSWRLDFGNLYKLIEEKLEGKICQATIFGSRPPVNDSVWKMAEQGGFTPIIVDRNVVNKEKKVDTGIITHMIKDAYTVVKKDADVLVLVAGDADFVPAIDTLEKDGFKVHVFFWGQVSQELKESVLPNFTCLDTYIDQIGYS